MTSEELRAMITYLRERVHLNPEETVSPTITFLAPSKEDMLGAGLNEEGVKWLLHVPWWKEMVSDIIETPEYCDPSDTPQQVLEYAKDVITDYIRKRAPFNVTD
jgi:hypothetical protein